MNEEEDIEEKIIKCVGCCFKSITQISDELEENRNRIRLHVDKLNRCGKLVKIESDDERVGVKGYKYKTSIFVPKIG
jgi:biotin operon repressor